MRRQVLRSIDSSFDTVERHLSESIPKTILASFACNPIRFLEIHAAQTCTSTCLVAWL